MTHILTPASLSQSRTVVLLGILIASIATILSSCGTPAATSQEPAAAGALTQAQLPADWPEEVMPPSGFSLEYAVGGSDDGRTDFTAQYVSFGDQSDAAANYIQTLIKSGFALDEQRPDLGIWVLKGFGVRVEIILDDSHANLTWLAVSVFTQ